MYLSNHRLVAKNEFRGLTLKKITSYFMSFEKIEAALHRLIFGRIKLKSGEGPSSLVKARVLSISNIIRGFKPLLLSRPSNPKNKDSIK